MTEQKSGSHWDSLAEKLGAEPGSQAPPPQRPQVNVTRIRPELGAATKAARPAANWTALAQELGIPVPEPPPSAGETAKRAAPPPQPAPPPRAAAPPRPPSPAPASPPPEAAHRPPRYRDDSRERSRGGDEEGGDGRHRRRRRGRRGGRGRDGGPRGDRPPSESGRVTYEGLPREDLATGPSDDVPQLYDFDVEEGLEAAPPPPAQREARPAEEGEPRRGRRRRRRGRRGGRAQGEFSPETPREAPRESPSPAEAFEPDDVAFDDDRPEPEFEPFAEGPAPTPLDRPVVGEESEGDLESPLEADTDEGEGEAEDGSDLARIHKAIPSWQDAVGVIIDANMAARARSPHPSRYGRRGRG
ncbi:MAG: hypothetical protein HYS13_12305 [Planctomycetia bacterium]|nr:hypothetical protein [Planctomycetia bacterium]